MFARIFILIASFAFLAPRANAQTSIRPTALSDTMSRGGGAWARVEIENGDTTYLLSLPVVRIAARRNFKDLKEQRLYNLYTRAARNVYPYAVQAIGLYEDIQAETEGMNKWKRRRHIRHEHKELKEDFTEKLKKLSKTEGKVLIKMIERQLNQPFYEVIRQTRGGTTAAYWNTLGKMNGYHLKEGYRLGEDDLLDSVLLDYDFGDAIWRSAGY